LALFDLYYTGEEVPEVYPFLNGLLNKKKNLVYNSRVDKKLLLWTRVNVLE
jgi:hypothetical protein